MLFQPTVRSLLVLAPAKLNLFLRIFRKREDGFHDLETVMTAIDIFDSIELTPNDSDGIRLRVQMASPQRGTGQQIESIPTGPENLVVRAAQLLKDFAGVSHGVNIHLIKRIPSAAGMGGGSSDAAATLAGLNRFWNLGLPRTTLIELAARLGSDIGFFLGGSSTAVCRGRGELVEPLRRPASLHFVIAKPASGLSTAQVFRHCRPSDTGRTADEFIRVMQSTRSAQMVRLLHNDLQGPAEELNGDVRELKSRFSRLPVLAHLMSGSGTAYFGICPTLQNARFVASRLRALGIAWVHVAKTCG